MRVGVILDTTSWQVLRAESECAEAAGLDLCWLDERPHGDSACSGLVAACTLASVTQGLRILAVVVVGSHPIGLAEEIAVADQLLGGRLTAVLSGADPGLVAETLDVIEAALAPAPFRHEGVRWTLPRTPGATVRVTPAPAQLELPIWLSGSELATLAATRNLPWVGDGTNSRRRDVRYARRNPSIFTPTLAAAGGVDAAATVAALRDSRARRGIDVAIARLSWGDSAKRRLDSIRMLGERVRPQLQIENLSADLVRAWDEPDS